VITVYAGGTVVQLYVLPDVLILMCGLN